ncbi:MAG: hypothetical protein HRT61_00595 [Ekhidna sp.]|nr:hypothetical protein [Ekhidna sp.]
MSNCIAPHEHEELMLVEEGIKPLAIIYHDKNPKMYRAACSSSLIKHRKLVRAGVIAIATKPQYIDIYMKLVKDRKLYTRTTFQVLMGGYLGYTSEEIIMYLTSNESKTCTCIECGGELK